MAMELELELELEDCCAICLESWEKVSYVMPCLHQFCYQCILQWAEKKPKCPLCNRRIQSLLHSVQADDDDREHVITPSAAPSAVVHQARRPASHPATLDSQGTHAAREQEGTQERHLTPSPTTSSSPSRSTGDELPSTSSAAIGGHPSSHPSAPSATPAEQEEPQQQQPEETMPGPSIPHRHRQRATGRRRQSLKSKASIHEFPPAKK